MLGRYAETADATELPYNLDPELSRQRHEDPTYLISSDSGLMDVSEDTDATYHIASSPPPMIANDGPEYRPTASLGDMDYNYVGMDVDDDEHGSTDADEEQDTTESTIVAGYRANSGSFSGSFSAAGLSFKRSDDPIQVIRDVIDHEVDTPLLAGIQPVDLSRFGLTEVPEEVADLRNLVRLDDRRRELINLVLAHNALTSLPPSLFDVGNIQCLSLRYNELTELPPAVAKLHNLRELNVSHNQLRFLPMELRNLNLEVLTTYPNPFLEPPKSNELEQRILYSDRPPRLLELAQRCVASSAAAKVDVLKLSERLQRRERLLVRESVDAYILGRACSGCSKLFVRPAMVLTRWVRGQGDYIPYQARFCSTKCAESVGALFGARYPSTEEYSELLSQ